MTRNLAFKIARRGDIRHWQRYLFPVEWEERSQRIAQLIPTGSRVVEFGAGLCHLKNYLHESCTYLAFDLVVRTPETVAIDLNRRPLPDLRHTRPQVAVFGGVLEYVVDLQSLVSWVGAQCRLCVASYECATSRAWTVNRAIEIVDRTSIGWVNSYCEDEFKALFTGADFECIDKRVWNTSDPGQIFVFRNRQTG